MPLMFEVTGCIVVQGEGEVLNNAQRQKVMTGDQTPVGRHWECLDNHVVSVEY